MQLREGVFFPWDDESVIAFTIFSICHSPKKSSTAQKVYKRDRKAFAGLNLSVSADALPPPLPRGGLGIAENFSSPPEAPLLGELSSEARLRGCTKENPTVSTKKDPLSEMALREGVFPFG